MVIALMVTAERHHLQSNVDANDSQYYIAGLHGEPDGQIYMKMLRSFILLGALSLAAVMSQAAPPEIKLVLKDHKFAPTEVTAPAGQKLKLVIENQDATPEEFESYALNREKIVPPGGRIVVFVGPLKPGRYEFFGEFNAKTARGWLVIQP
jgi:hypothetical protein